MYRLFDDLKVIENLKSGGRMTDFIKIPWMEVKDRLQATRNKLVNKKTFNLKLLK